MRINKNILLLYMVALLELMGQNVRAQYSNATIQQLAKGAKEMFTWHVKEAKAKGYMMFLDIPYAIKENPQNYISLTVARRYENYRPAFISFSLPDNVVENKGLLLSFSRGIQLNSDSKAYQLLFNEHWSNNRTYTARLWNGFLVRNGKSDSIDIFKDFMQNKQLFISFYDSSGIHKLAIPLGFFQKQYKDLPAPAPAPSYSTGNPADTALTAEERKDKKVFDDGDIPTSWAIAGITDPIRFKHFIKYFRYLVDHNEKQKIAQLLVYPLTYVTPVCKDSSQFIKNYNKIFDKQMRKAIDSAKLDELSRDYKGVFLGKDYSIMYIRQSGNKYQIYHIENTAFFYLKEVK